MGFENGQGIMNERMQVVLEAGKVKGRLSLIASRKSAALSADSFWT